MITIELMYDRVCWVQAIAIGLARPNTLPVANLKCLHCSAFSCPDTHLPSCAQTPLRSCISRLAIAGNYRGYSATGVDDGIRYLNQRLCGNIDEEDVILLKCADKVKSLFECFIIHATGCMNFLTGTSQAKWLPLLRSLFLGPSGS